MLNEISIDFNKVSALDPKTLSMSLIMQTLFLIHVI